MAGPQDEAGIKMLLHDTADLPLVKELGGAVFQRYTPPRRSTLLQLQTRALWYGGDPLLRDLDVQLRRLAAFK